MANNMMGSAEMRVEECEARDEDNTAMDACAVRSIFNIFNKVRF